MSGVESCSDVQSDRQEAGLWSNKQFEMSIRYLAVSVRTSGPRGREASLSASLDKSSGESEAGNSAGLYCVHSTHLPAPILGILV
jgi:hypothetical protein